MSEATGAPVAGIEFFHDFELHLFDRNEHHLGDTFARLHFVTLATAIPAGDEHLPLVVRIDEPGEIAQHEPMFVAQAGTWQKYSGKSGIANMDGKAGRNQNGCAGLDREHVVNTCPHIKASRAVRRIVWQWNTLANPRVQYLQFN